MTDLSIRSFWACERSIELSLVLIDLRRSDKISANGLRRFTLKRGFWRRMTDNNVDPDLGSPEMKLIFACI
jgi:hypothetical protein